MTSMANKENYSNLSDKLRTSMLHSILFEASPGAKIASSNITCSNEHLRNSSIPATSYYSDTSKKYMLLLHKATAVGILI
jgi:hypothetical protein